MAGQLSNHFVERMRKIYELEPFIKLAQCDKQRHDQRKCNL